MLVLRRLLSSNAAKAAHAKPNVVVFGSGLMGAGIVQVTAAAGLSVTMVDVSDEALHRGLKTIEASLSRVAKKTHKDDKHAAEKAVSHTLSHIKTSTHGVAAVAGADLVIEAIVENLGKKQELFRQLDAAARPTTVFASNTSSLPIHAIAKGIRCRVSERHSQQAGCAGRTGSAGCTSSTPCR
eukprot:TRINITY_DN110_c0_g1_i4.p1 TRINITY_DN110_c0_g1~~TRINITY_DN110_c0_g1_i4.p1  ORF type:complete len:183 (+),score=36.24 TRINITY_DN110_c0_g1_i4:34-582(+)